MYFQICLTLFQTLTVAFSFLQFLLFFSLTYHIWLLEILTLVLAIQLYPCWISPTVIASTCRLLLHCVLHLTSWTKGWTKWYVIFLRKKKEKVSLFRAPWRKLENLSWTGSCSWRCSQVIWCTLRAELLAELRAGNRISGMGTHGRWQCLAYPAVTELESLEDHGSMGIGLYFGSCWLHWLLKAVDS